MDQERFDALTRSLVTVERTRRGLLGLLASATLGVASQLGLAAVAETRTRHHKTSRKPTRASQEKRTKHLEAQGKNKGKKHHKKHQPPPSPPSPLPPLPEACQDCNPCELCQDGACYVDQSQDGVRCEGSGAGCGYCQQGTCVPAPERKCADGSCPAHDECCDGEWMCPGNICHPIDLCCPGTKPCGPTACIPNDQCCHTECPAGQAFDAATCSCKDVCPPGRACDDGCCPEGMGCAFGHVGVCCNDAGHCQCASGYTGGCNGQCCRNGCCSGRCCAS